MTDRMMTDVLWENLTAPVLRALARADAAVIVPTASIEQHGQHLPTRCDTLLAGEVARRAAVRVAERQPVVVTPVIWSGMSEHHMAFGGTISLDLETYVALVRGVCRSIRRHGFRRLFLLNGHGGNRMANRLIADGLAQEADVPVVVLDYPAAALSRQRQILERQSTVNHACEAETSMVMALTPHLVRTDLLATAKGKTGGGSPGPWGAAYSWQSFAAKTDTGVLGDAETATPEKGEQLLEAISTDIAGMILDGKLWDQPVHRQDPVPEPPGLGIHG